MNLILALLTASSFAQVPAGEVITPSIDVDITPDGFDAVEDIVPMFVPSNVNIPYTESFSGDCVWGVGTRTGFSLNGGKVYVNVTDVQIVPVTPSAGTGAELELSLNADVWVNDPGDTMDLYIEAICIGDTCDSYIDPFPVSATASIGLELVTDPITGALTLDSTVNLDPNNIVLGLQDNDIHLNNCVVGSILDTLNLYGILIGVLEGQIDSLLGDALGDLDGTVDDALAGIGDSLVIQESIDLEGNVVDLYLAPSDLWSTEQGLRFQLEGGASAQQVSECIARWDTGSSLETPSGEPLIGELPGALADPYHVSATIQDEFVNQVFYAVWQTGILCQTIGGPGPQIVELPIPVDSTLLSLLAPGVYDDQFPEAGALLLVTRPEKPPILNNQPDDIDIEIEDLGLEIYFDKDGRKAKLVDVTLGLDAGLGTSFDTTTGVLGIDIDLDNALSATVNQNEFEPGTDAEVAQGVEGLLSNPAIAGLITDALSGLAGIGMPPIGFDTNGDGIAENFGVQDMVLTTAGDQDDWLGAYVWVGPVEYEYAGCEGGCGDGCGGSSSGCGSSGGCELTGGGCDSGSGCGSSTPGGGPPTGGCNLDSGGCGSSSCNVSGVGGGRAIAIVFAVLLVLRRRQSD